MSKLIMSDKSVKSNNFNMKLCKNLKLNKIELAVLHK